MNKVILVGRLTRDPALRYTANNKAVCDFTIATNRPVVRDGERVADFINCRVWGKTAENLTKYQNKGNLIAVIGRMQVDRYEDKEGNTRYSNYVLVEDLEYLERKNEDTQEAKQEEKNEFEDFNINTEVQQQFGYDSSDLPF